jgi:hypothetical protein
MKEDALQKGLPVPDQAAVREREYRTMQVSCRRSLTAEVA